MEGKQQRASLSILILLSCLTGIAKSVLLLYYYEREREKERERGEREREKISKSKEKATRTVGVRYVILSITDITLNSIELMFRTQIELCHK